LACIPMIDQCWIQFCFLAASTHNHGITHDLYSGSRICF
jgi:hypothetical protein